MEIAGKILNKSMLGALLLLLLTSCGIFSTRDPEEPGSTSVPVFEQPDQPQNVIQNLENAVRALNVDNYRRCLDADNFEYDPSGIARNSNPEVWERWGFAEEEVYFNNMRSEADGLSGHDLQLTDGEYVSISSDEHQFEAEYQLTIQHNRSGLPEEARGRIRLVMGRDESGKWAIETWIDSGEGSDFTWSDFRAEFLN